jgi:hypothetical protein
MFLQGIIILYNKFLGKQLPLPLQEWEVQLPSSRGGKVFWGRGCPGMVPKFGSQLTKALKKT